MTVEIHNKKFEELLPLLLQIKKPAFFFLDPFTYSIINMEHLKQLMNLDQSEVFLFIPIFHSYRFAKKNYQKHHKTRQFIETFTSKGMGNYQDITEFLKSVRDQLKSALKLQYVRPVLLDDGRCKNAIALLTKHQKGMLLMNKIVLKNTQDGITCNIGNEDQLSLFSINVTPEFQEFENNLKGFLQKKSNITTNRTIVHWTIEQGFLPKHAQTALKKLTKSITVKELNGDTITNTPTKWNIAEAIKKITNFTYGDNHTN